MGGIGSGRKKSVDYELLREYKAEGHSMQEVADRIVPLSKGGKHAWDNIQLACRSCNSRKGDRF